MHDLNVEKEYLSQGYELVIGVDEVGRGSWAGPFVLAGFSLIIPHDVYPVIPEINDSKLLTKKTREVISEKLGNQLAANHIAINLLEKSADYISKFGLAKAIREAMTELREQFTQSKVAIIADRGLPVPENLRAEDSFISLVKGDRKVYSIAAAANYAKVYRDKLMCELAKTYPGYLFEKNVGYGTKGHQAGLAKLGPCAIHRSSYKPISYYSL